MAIYKAPDRTALVHIGIDKTGTTFIQNFCTDHRMTLLQGGLNYPRPAIKDGFSHVEFSKAHGFLWNEEASSETSQMAGNDLLDPLNSEEHSALISTECFCYYNSTLALQRLKSWLNAQGYLKYQIIVYLRNQVDWFISLYSEYLRWGNRETIGKFHEICRWRLWHSNLLNDWEGVFGREAMVVRSYDNTKTLLEDFVSVFGGSAEVQKLAQQYRPKFSNFTLSQIMLEHLRTLQLNLPSDRFYDFVINRLSLVVPRFLPELFARRIWPLPEAFLEMLPALQADNNAICYKYNITLPALDERARLYNSTVQPMTLTEVKDSAQLMLIELMSEASAVMLNQK